MNSDSDPIDPAAHDHAVEDSLSPDRAAESDPVTDPADPVPGQTWPETDIEEAYLKALEAMEDLPWDDLQPAADPEALLDPVASSDGTLPFEVNVNVALEIESPVAGNESLPNSVTPSASDAVTATATNSGPRLATGTERAVDTPEERLNATPAQVVEAALFVGGTPLTAKKLAGLLRGSLDVAAIEQLIDDLNAEYVAQARPYEIRLRDGGYRLELRSEYDRLRHRVFGSGPREVRLSQEVIEVLALVAYRQPISQPEIEGHGKQNAGSLLRQLLRRDLVAIQRGDGGRQDIRYHTTPRFLSVFGLGNISELPQVDDLALK